MFLTVMEGVYQSSVKYNYLFSLIIIKDWSEKYHTDYGLSNTIWNIKLGKRTIIAVIYPLYLSFY